MVCSHRGGGGSDIKAAGKDGEMGINAPHTVARSSSPWLITAQTQRERHREWRCPSTDALPLPDPIISCLPEPQRHLEKLSGSSAAQREQVQTPQLLKVWRWCCRLILMLKCITIILAVKERNNDVKEKGENQPLVSVRPQTIHPPPGAAAIMQKKPRSPAPLLALPFPEWPGSGKGPPQGGPLKASTLYTQGNKD